MRAGFRRNGPFGLASGRIFHNLSAHTSKVASQHLLPQPRILARFSAPEAADGARKLCDSFIGFHDLRL